MDYLFGSILKITLALFHSSVCRGGSHILFGIVVALRPFMNPKIIKKRPKKFTRHQSDSYVKIKC